MVRKLLHANQTAVRMADEHAPRTNSNNCLPTSRFRSSGEAGKTQEPVALSSPDPSPLQRPELGMEPVRGHAVKIRSNATNPNACATIERHLALLYVMQRHAKPRIE